VSQSAPDGDRDAVQGVRLSKEPLASGKPAGVRLSKSPAPGDATEPVSLAKEMTTPDLPLLVVTGAEATRLGAVPQVGAQMNTQAPGSAPTSPPVRAGNTRIGLALAAVAVVVVAVGLIWLTTSGSKTHRSNSTLPAPSASTPSAPNASTPSVNQFPVGRQVLAGEYIVQAIFDPKAPVPSWLDLTNRGGVYTSAFLPVRSAYGRGAFNPGALKLVSGGTSFTETDSNGQTYSGSF
jgi:hypothetical protein